jgi:leucyl/phenylalanyl-tRNA--protein transferase
MHLPELGPAPDAPFPPVESALREPDGLLAWGGDLSPVRLVNAYRHGCFPWFDRGQPPLWWSPDPRLVLRPERFHVSRSFARFLRRCDWRLTADSRFEDVIATCARIRRTGQGGTWILPSMIDAYVRLHRLGHAHSVEVIDAGDRLVGGIYGVAIGAMMFGESMFSAAENGSKIALLGLCRYMQARGWPLLDCQMDTPHLRTLGAELVPRDGFIAESRRLCGQPQPQGSWTQAFGTRHASALPDATFPLSSSGSTD